VAARLLDLSRGNRPLGTDEKRETTPKHREVGVAIETSLPVCRRLEMSSRSFEIPCQTTASGATARDWPSRREALPPLALAGASLRPSNPQFVGGASHRAHGARRSV
jgi:hypothetical protein